MERGCAFDNEQVVTIWDERYCTAAAPTISTTKQAEVVHGAEAEGLLALRPWAFNEARAWATIQDVHDAAYVSAVRGGEPRQLAEAQGFSWSPAFARAVARIWAGHAAACRLALREGLVFHPVSGAHHADRASGAGFCTLEDDPIGGIPGVDAGFLAWRDRFVIEEVVRRGIPLVINLAGGYQPDGATVALHVETVRVASAFVRRARADSRIAV